MTSLVGPLKRLLIGPALRSEAQQTQLLPKWIALPVFSSDPISSVAYATEQILLVPDWAGRPICGCVHVVAVAVAVLLGSWCCPIGRPATPIPAGAARSRSARPTSGRMPALTAAAALLVDYVMTVAVSVVAGVVGITSAVAEPAPHAAQLSVGWWRCWRWPTCAVVRQIGRVFALPTYAFVALVFLMFLSPATRRLRWRPSRGRGGRRASVGKPAVGGICTVLLALRAFAAGCYRADRGGGDQQRSARVPETQVAQRRHHVDHHRGLAVVMFAGITVLAERMKARAYPDGFPSVISQLARRCSAADFDPVLPAVPGRHRRHPDPRREHRLQRIPGARLDSGAEPLPAPATALSWRPARVQQRDPATRRVRDRVDRRFNANIDKLIQLYIIGVFTCFTLSQAGMVAALAAPDHRRRYHHRRATRYRSPAGDQRRRRLATGVVVVIVVGYKFLHGA